MQKKYSVLGCVSEWSHMEKVLILDLSLIQKKGERSCKEWKDATRRFKRTSTGRLLKFFPAVHGELDTRKAAKTRRREPRCLMDIWPV